jgi:indolepyruvate ferredoxin oxidoreductase beta subunit
LKKQTLIIAGVGGRGVLVGSTILLNIAFQQDLPVFSADEYGMSQRGGSVVSHLKIGPYQSPIIGTGEADILLGFEASEGIKNLPMLREGGLCILNKPGKGTGNPSLDAYLDNKEIHLYTLDADRIASEIGSPLSANMVLLGFFSYFGKPIFSFTKLKEYIEHSSPARFLEFNRKALKLGQLEAKNLNHKGVS